MQASRNHSPCLPWGPPGPLPPGLSGSHSPVAAQYLLLSEVCHHELTWNCEAPSLTPPTPQHPAQALPLARAPNIRGQLSFHHDYYGPPTAPALLEAGFLFCIFQAYRQSLKWAGHTAGTYMTFVIRKTGRRQNILMPFSSSSGSGTFLLNARPGISICCVSMNTRVFYCEVL